MSGSRPQDRAAGDQPGDRPGRASGWRRLGRVLEPRLSRAQLLGAVLVAALGFALVAQLRQSDEQGLSSLRQSDLVRILDDVGDRRDRLAAETSDLQAQQRQLVAGASGSQAAIDAARERLDALGVLAGTLPATGPGIEVFLSDPDASLRAATVLDLVQELRDAGAEAIQVGPVRVVASTAFTDEGGAVRAGGTVLQAPYTVLAIGDSQTLATALEIPGGIVASLPEGARATVAAREEVRVTALHAVRTPQYARPAAGPAAEPAAGTG
ncbi:MAG TPA: DUF881 domain-containing protein [Actinomycetales bacterium]|jgi:uncharacterized protein YlxW (UPF0749 family)